MASVIFDLFTPENPKDVTGFLYTSIFLSFSIPLFLLNPIVGGLFSTVVLSGLVLKHSFALSKAVPAAQLELAAELTRINERIRQRKALARL